MGKAWGPEQGSWLPPPKAGTAAAPIKLSCQWLHQHDLWCSPAMLRSSGVGAKILDYSGSATQKRQQIKGDAGCPRKLAGTLSKDRLLFQWHKQNSGLAEPLARLCMGPWCSHLLGSMEKALVHVPTGECHLKPCQHSKLCSYDPVPLGKQIQARNYMGNDTFSFATVLFCNK